MTDRRLQPAARTAILLSGLYAAAAGLCGVFVSVYLWVNSNDFNVIFKHYLALYVVTPPVFLLSGWYSAAHDRLHAYRLGLVFHAVYYAVLLALRERSPEYAVHLGALQALAWGIFFSGANTFNFDVTVEGKRESYLGALLAANGTFRFLAPLLGGLIIAAAPAQSTGFHIVFAVSVLLFMLAFAISFKMPSDSEPRPFNLRRALFPSKEQGDWRRLMAAALTLCGTFSIFAFLLGLLMYMQTGQELHVGGYASLQALVGIATALIIGRVIVPRNRKTAMAYGVALLVAAGILAAWRLNVTTLIVFGILRAISGPLFGIPHQSLRLDTIARSVEDPRERIEYICAWEVPLGVGRILIMLVLMALYNWLEGNEIGLRLAILLLCSMRIFTYFILAGTSAVRKGV